jgi:predicted HicB family RNase H-like nuclease
MSKNEKEQIVTSLKVDPNLWKRAKMKALEHDITLGQLVDEAVKDWIEKKECGKKKDE